MAERESTQGVSCPNCGGMVPIPEGQSIVRCPFCDQRAFVAGERGLRRHQVPVRIPREQAMQALHSFFASSMAIARDARDKAQLNEAFLAYLPFWSFWGRLAGWAFGEKQVGSGNNRRYEPREVRLVQEINWTGAACDVGEFGVDELQLTDQVLQPFNAEELHAAGMVFEPASSFSAAQQAAETEFQAQLNRRAGLDRLAQLFVRSFRQRQALIYYPLWVLRYLYRGRAFQVVVDGYSGKVLYGKAPGNTLYRAVMLVLGMAAGAFVAVDVTALALYFLSDSEDTPIWLAGLCIFAGVALMYTGYRRFRYGEQYERRIRSKRASAKSSELLPGIENPLAMISGISNAKDVEEWVRRLT